MLPGFSKSENQSAGFSGDDELIIKTESISGFDSRGIYLDLSVRAHAAEPAIQTVQRCGHRLAAKERMQTEPAL